MIRIYAKITGDNVERVDAFDDLDKIHCEIVDNDNAFIRVMIRTTHGANEYMLIRKSNILSISEIS